jgi:SAM-dependent methyltransferase
MLFEKATQLPHGRSTLQERRRSMILDVSLFKKLYLDLPNQIADFSGSCGVDYGRKRIIDVGSGNGVCDLGCAVSWNAEFVGVDVVETLKDDLLFAADNAGFAEQATKAKIQFHPSSTTALPFADSDFDHAISWSVFEHVWHPIAMLKEVHRVLKPGGTLFLQIWPFWKSEWGAHLFNVTEGWAHITTDRESLLSSIRDRVEAQEDSYDSCTKIEIDDLQRAILASGLVPSRIEFIVGSFSPPTAVQHLSWLNLGIAGIKLLARKP